MTICWPAESLERWQRRRRPVRLRHQPTPGERRESTRSVVTYHRRVDLHRPRVMRQQCVTTGEHSVTAA